MKKIIVEEVALVAVICTGHMSVEDSEIVQKLAWDRFEVTGQFWIEATGFGWILRIGMLPCEWREILEKEGVSEGCISNLFMLENAGFDWIHFQSDAQVVSGLEHWDW